MGRALGVNAYLSRMVTDPGGSGRRHHEVGIRCRKCSREEWATAQDPGWGRRIFKQKGWDCGNGLSRHTCPDCLHGKTRLPATQRAKARAQDFPQGVQLPPPPVALRPAATIHHLPEPDRPIIHTHVPEEPMPSVSATAFADAMGAATESRHLAKGSRNKPFGFSTEGNAAQAARRILVRDGVVHPTREQHYKTHRSADGSWSYEIVSRKGAGLVPTGKQRVAVEGRPQARRAHAVGAAERQLDNMGIAKPMEGVHFEILGSPGEGWVFRLLEAARPAPAKPEEAPQPSRVTGGGRLSRHDAKKDALAVLQAARKSGGAPVEGVDYWITQDGYNLWGWRTTDPNPNQAPVEPPAKEATVGEVVTIAEPPRKASPADNRKIHDLLEECYDSDRQRYRQAFKDAYVCQKLNVPRAWVVSVREQFFGPEVNEQDAEAQRQKIAKAEEALAAANLVISKSSAALELYVELETLVGELRKVVAELKR